MKKKTYCAERDGHWAMKKYLSAYQEQVSYLFYGVLTMLLNYGLFWILNRLLRGRYVLLANLLAFIVSTAFAYITNKLFVFHSNQWKLRPLLLEAAAFVSARLFSFMIEEAGLYISAYVFMLDQYERGGIDGVMLSKVILSIAATILNYFFSKFWVFSHKKRKK